MFPQKTTHHVWGGVDKKALPLTCASQSAQPRNLGTGGWDKQGHRAGTWGAFQGRWLGLGHGVGLTDRWVAGTGNGVGLGDKHGESEPESDLQGLTWGHGTGKRVRLTV